MSRVKHNALHQFSAGFNTVQDSGPASLPFATPGQQGWKIQTENFGGGATPADGILWESVVETSGTTTHGVNGGLITTDGNDNSSGWLGWTTPTYVPGAATKKFYLETSVILTAATMASNEMFVGFTSDQSTTAFVAADGLTWAFDDGFGFGKLDAETEISFISGQNETGAAHQTVGLGSTFTTATRTTLACYYDGTNFNLYKDNVFVKSAAKSTLNDDAATGAVIYAKAGTGAAQTLLVHYITLATEL